MELKRNLNPNTIPSYVNPVKLFLESNDIDLNWRKIRRLFPSPVKATGDSAYSTEDVRKMLNCTPNLRNKTLIHFLASTGCRIGAMPELKLKHLTEMPLGCKAVLVYEDSIEEHYTFLTPEASKILDDYLELRKKDNETLTNESPLFRTTYSLGMAKAKPMSKKAMQAVIDRAANNAGIRHHSDKQKGRYHVQLDHGFRKRFDTILKLNRDVNDNVVEKMMGHKRGLDGHYLKPTKEQMFDEFKKGIPDLSTDSTQRLLIEKKVLEDEKSKLEKKNSEFEIKNQYVKDLVNLLEADPTLVKKMENLEKFLDEKIASRLSNWLGSGELSPSLQPDVSKVRLGI